MEPTNNPAPEDTEGSDLDRTLRMLQQNRQSQRQPEPTRARIDLTGEGDPAWIREIDTKAPPRVGAEARSLGDAMAGDEGSDLDQTLRMIEERRKAWQPPKPMTTEERLRAAGEALKKHLYTRNKRPPALPAEKIDKDSKAGEFAGDIINFDSQE